MHQQIPLAQLDEATDEHVLLRTATQSVDDAETALALLESEELTVGRAEDAEWALRDALNRVQLLKRGLESERQTTQTKQVRLRSLCAESDV